MLIQQDVVWFDVSVRETQAEGELPAGPGVITSSGHRIEGTLGFCLSPYLPSEG